MSLTTKAFSPLVPINIALAGAYYAAAQVGLAASIGPGQVTAVWPPSGVALAAFMVWGWRVLPGVAVGSLAVNWLGYLGPILAYQAAALWGAAWLTAGSLIQAGLAAMLLRTAPDAMSSAPLRHTLRYAATVATCCTVAASLGSAGLLTLGVISSTEWFYGWLTWWVGDCAGMLVVAPLLLHWLHGAIPRHAVSFPILSMGLGLTLVTTFVVGHLEREAMIGRFRANAHVLGLMLQGRMDVVQRDLEVLQALHPASTDFQSIANQFHQRSGTMSVFAWSPVVQHEDRLAFEKRLGRVGMFIREIGTDGSLVPARPRARYLPVETIAPPAGHETLVGIDEWHDPARRQAIQRAVETGASTVTQPVSSLARTAAEHPTLMIYAPVWREFRGSHAQVQGEPLHRLNGMISARVDLASWLKIADELPDLANAKLLLHDPQSEDLAGVSSRAGQMPVPWSRRTEAVREQEIASGVYERVSLLVADRQWQLVAQPEWAGAMWLPSWLQAGMCVSGLSFTALLSGFMALRRRREQDQEREEERLRDQVAARTSELSQANADLLREVAERCLLEKELKTARAHAEHASEAKSMFLANMSHEIRTPLNAVLGYAQLLREDAAPHTLLRSRVQSILDAGQRLLVLINDVLDLSKIEAGNLQLQSKPFLIRAELEGAVALVRHRAQAKSLHLGVDIQMDDTQWVLGDRGKFGQVVVNLLSNAVKFTDKGSVRLTAWREGDLIHVDVADTGPGMSADEQQQILQPFTQGRAGQEKGGTGLGLTVARHIAQAMHGELEIRSACGTGTVVHATAKLPATDPAPSTESKLSDPDARLPTLDPATPCRVLVVDDDEDSLAVLAQMLQRVGCEVVQATDGSQALGVFRETGFDMIFTDIRMPVLDGIGLLRAVRDSHPSTPVAAVSASSLAHQRSDYVAQGFNDFVGKPYAFDDIRQVLERHAGVRWQPVPPEAPAVPTAPPTPIPAAPASAGVLLAMAEAAMAGDPSLVRQQMDRLLAAGSLTSAQCERLQQAVRAYDFEQVEQWTRQWHESLQEPSQGTLP